MYRKLLISLFMILSFVIIALGGYQCATKVTHEPRQSIPIDYAGGAGSDDGGYSDSDYYYEEGYGQDPYGDNAGLPERPEDSCARGQYRQLADQYGERASFRFDRSSLEDYRLGQQQNFDIRCARMYLYMSRLSSSSSIYKGMLSLSYEDGNSIKLQNFRSGFTEEENKYNRWTSGSSITNRRFYAIFEDEHTALILKLEDIREVDIRDGETAYLGAGDLYYKMFRIWTGDRNDVCYSKGTYVSLARQQLPRRASCWLLGTGAFSCRPNGVLPPKAQVTNINITGNLKCYSRLGRFFGLEIKEAFNGLP